MLEVNGERWLSAKDLAGRFGVDTSTVHCWHRKKGLPLVRLFRGMHIEEKALAAWMHAQGGQPVAEYGPSAGSGQAPSAALRAGKPRALVGRR